MLKKRSIVDTEASCWKKEDGSPNFGYKRQDTDENGRCCRCSAANGDMVNLKQLEESRERILAPCR